MAQMKSTNPLTAKPNTGILVVDRFGAYIASSIAVLACLMLALVMPPEFRQYLVTAAVAIAIVSLFRTNLHDAFLVRGLGFIGALIVLVFAKIMIGTAEADILLSGAGCLAAVATWFGNGDFDW